MNQNWNGKEAKRVLSKLIWNIPQMTTARNLQEEISEEDFRFELSLWPLSFSEEEIEEKVREVKLSSFK